LKNKRILVLGVRWRYAGRLKLKNLKQLGRHKLNDFDDRSFKNRLWNRLPRSPFRDCMGSRPIFTRRNPALRIAALGLDPLLASFGHLPSPHRFQLMSGVSGR
jgi:hypothetical protein